MAKTHGGAYVHCLIDFVQQEGAEHLARYYLEQDGWQALETEEVRIIERSDYEDDLKYLQYFNEAEEDGCSFIYYGYPPPRKRRVITRSTPVTRRKKPR